MTSTPSVRTGAPGRQGLPVPGRMDLVADWDAPGRDRLELYADPSDHDGYVIGVSPYGAETAAYLVDVDLDDPVIEWCGRFASLTELWRDDQSRIVRSELAAWEASC